MAKNTNEVVVSEVQKVAKKERRTGQKKSCISRDKENICVFDDKLYAGGKVVSKSPLPADFPRIPLQDITAVLSPANILQLEEGESSIQKSHLTRSKTRKSAFSCPVRYELNIVEVTKVSTQEQLCEKREDVSQVADVMDIGAKKATGSSKPESKGPITSPTASEADCFPVQQQSKRRRPQPRASAGAERSTSMLKFR